jgi:hypothetical protein
MGKSTASGKETMSTPPVPSSRAKEIAEGLLRTGRGSDVCLVGTWLQLRAINGNIYWISFDGAVLLRGDDVEGAEQLQPSFADAMARAGVVK